MILAAGLSSYKSGMDAMIESTETAASIVMKWNIIGTWELLLRFIAARTAWDSDWHDPGFW